MADFFNSNFDKCRIKGHVFHEIAARPPYSYPNVGGNESHLIGQTQYWENQSAEAIWLQTTASVIIDGKFETRFNSTISFEEVS